jgi:predicted transcriptional regulator
MDSPLKTWRESLKITQPQLADAADVSQGHISKAENGHVELGEKLTAFLVKVGASKVIEDHKVYMEEVKGKLEEIIKEAS